MIDYFSLVPEIAVARKLMQTTLSVPFLRVLGVSVISVRFLDPKTRGQPNTVPYLHLI